MHKRRILVGKLFLLLLCLSHGKEAKGEALKTYQSPFSFERSLIVMSCVVVLWCKQKPFQVQPLPSSWGGEQGWVFLRTGAGHSRESVFHSARTRQNREKNMSLNVIKFKHILLLVKNRGVKAAMSPCSDYLNPFPFRRNTRPQKLQVTAILDSLYFIPKLDKRGGIKYSIILTFTKNVSSLFIINYTFMFCKIAEIWRPEKCERHYHFSLKFGC